MCCFNVCPLSPMSPDWATRFAIDAVWQCLALSRFGSSKLGFYGEKHLYLVYTTINTISLHHHHFDLLQTSPGRAMNRSFLAPTRGGNSFLGKALLTGVAWHVDKVEDKWMWCQKCQANEEVWPGDKVKGHPWPDWHLGHLQQVGSPRGGAEKRFTRKV